jgi:hypothetical protein
MKNYRNLTKLTTYPIKCKYFSLGSVWEFRTGGEGRKRLWKKRRKK